MRCQCRGGLLIAFMGLMGVGTNAQTDALQDLGSVLKAEKNLTSFYSMIQQYPDILLQLPSKNGVTILAPNNEAFEKMAGTALSDALAQNNTDTVTATLQYHILKGTQKAADLVAGTSRFLPTLLTDAKFTQVTGGQVVTNVKQAGDLVVFVSGLGSRSTLVQRDLEFNGGVVQVISDLNILPANVTTTTTSFNLTSFQGALYAANKTENLTASSDVTIFAPINDAFQALGSSISSMTAEQLSSVLDYHVVPGRVIYSSNLTNGINITTQNGANLSVIQDGNNVYINSAQLLTQNILIANGVMHTLDNVLNPDDTAVKPDPSKGTQLPVFPSPSSASNLPFTSAIPCTQSCPVTSSASETATVTSSSQTSMRTSSSSAVAAAMAKETGLGAAGLLAIVGGAVMLI